MKKSLFFTSMLSLSLLVGCSDGTTTTNKQNNTTVESKSVTFKKIVSEKSGLTLSIPSHWEDVPITSGSLSHLFKISDKTQGTIQMTIFASHEFTEEAVIQSIRNGGYSGDIKFLKKPVIEEKDSTEYKDFIIEKENEFAYQGWFTKYGVTSVLTIRGEKHEVEQGPKILRSIET
ncbi:MAG: hypothetical protein ACI35O_03200 [Bacillaceae bacterium]